MQKEGKISENWYLVLGLEFDPNPVVSEEIIEQKIEEKRKFWARSANDLMHGPEYRKYTQMLPTIRRDMIGEENIRQDLIQDAVKRAYEPIDEMLKEIGQMEITEETVERIAKSLGSSPQIVKKRAKNGGIRVNQKEAEYQELYDKYYKEKPENAEKYSAMKTQLAVFHVNNLYEFLFPEQLWQKSCKNIPEILLAAAQEKRRTEFYKNDSLSGTGSKLCIQCEEIFATSETKKKYDDVIEYNERKAILDRVKEIYEITGAVSETSYTKSVVELSKMISPAERAEKILKAFCAIEKLPIQYQIASAKNSKENEKETNKKEQAEEWKYSQEFNVEQEDRKLEKHEVRTIVLASLFGLMLAVIFLLGVEVLENQQVGVGNNQGNKSTASTQGGSNTQPPQNGAKGDSTDTARGNDTESGTESVKNEVKGSDTKPTESGTKGNSTKPTESATKGNSTKPTEGGTKGNNVEPTKSATKENSAQPANSENEDDKEAITKCMTDFFDSVKVLKGEYKEAFITNAFSNELKDLRKQAEKLEEGIFAIEENDIIYATIEESSKDYSYSNITVYIQNNSTATCNVTISYINLPHAALIARMLTAKETEGEEDVSDSRWNRLYLENVKKAIKQKEVLEEEELIFYLEYKDNKWRISGCNDIIKAYNALAGSTLEELDYDWLEWYENGI